MTGVHNKADVLNFNGLGDGEAAPPSQADQLLHLKLLEQLCAIMDQFGDLQTQAAKDASAKDAKSDAEGQATAEVTAGLKSSSGSSHSPNTGAPTGSGDSGSGGALTGGVGAVGA